MQAHSHSHGEKKRLSLSLAGSFVGAIFIANSYLMNHVTGQGQSLAGASAFIGAMILGIPVIVRAVRDLLKRELHMNELVAIAVLACVARQEYTTAGIVSFLVLGLLMIVASYLYHRLEKRLLGAQADAAPAEQHPADGEPT